MSNWYTPVSPGQVVERWPYPEGGRFILPYGRWSAIPEAVAEVEGRVRPEIKGGEQVGGLSQIETLRIRPMPRAPVGVPLKVVPRAAAFPALPNWALAVIVGGVVVGGVILAR